MRRARLLLAAGAALLPAIAPLSAAPADAALALATTGPVCPAITSAQAFARADVVFEGIAQVGAVTTAGYLSTPTKFRVVRYLKGSGPAVITTAGGPRSGGGIGFISLASAGMLVKAGESWVVYGKGDPSGIVETSACYGSHRSGAAKPFVNESTSPSPSASPSPTPTGGPVAAEGPSSAWAAWAGGGVAGLALIMAIGWAVARTVVGTN